LKFNAPRRNLSIVIVDDSDELSTVYERYFKIIGLEVLAKFPSGVEFLSRFGKEKQAFTNSVILMDYNMPEIDGVETAKKLKKLNPGQTIILSTAEDLSNVKNHEGLFEAIIRKPFTLSELTKLIESLSSPIRVRGTRVLSDPEDIDSIILEIVADSEQKLCSVRNPSTIQAGAIPKGHVPSYVSSVSKGLKVFLVTEITRENLSFCRQLMMNRGVQLRHLDGVVPNLSIWDQKHVIEIVQDGSDSARLGHVLYSNLESKVSESQYLFEYFWNRASPAEERIRELEQSQESGNVTVVSGFEDNLRMRARMVHNSKVSYDICTVSGILSNGVTSKLKQECAEAIARGVHIRMIFEITKKDFAHCQELLKMGMEVRHLSKSTGSFALNEREFIGMITARHFGPNEDTRSIYSAYPDYVEEQRSIFEILWNSAMPATERLLEIEEEEFRYPKTRSD
jgi:CheY-like chemotaxis protein